MRPPVATAGTGPTYLLWNAAHWLVAVAHCFFFQAEDGIRDYKVTGVQTCALPILAHFAMSACSISRNFSGEVTRGSAPCAARKSTISRVRRMLSTSLLILRTIAVSVDRKSVV